MIELAALAIRNLAARHELGQREVNVMAAELESLRCSLEILAAHPTDSAATAHASRAFPELDAVMSLQLWVLSPEAVEEWHSCRAIVSQRSFVRRSWMNRLLHPHARSVGNLLG